MNDESVCVCVIDTDGLHSIASATANLKAVLTAKLKKGEIGVPACALKEFGELYSDEAEELKPHIAKTIIMKRAYRLGAARIADKMNSGFPRGSHDGNVELLVASIASAHQCPILTSPAQAIQYNGMGCLVVDVQTWVKDLEDAHTQ